MENIEDKNIEAIEYLVNQSTQGHHLLFNHGDIIQAIKGYELENKDFFTFENKNRVQTLLFQVIEKKSLREKHAFLESLSREDFDLLINAYFHLVDNTILAKFKLKH